MDFELFNTKFEYLYRDASNYKTRNTAVYEGELTEKEINEIFEKCDGANDFIPEQVEMPALGFEDITEDDHCWCEMMYITITEDKPTEYDKNGPIKAKDIYNNFMNVKEWDDVTYAVIPDTNYEKDI